MFTDVNSSAAALLDGGWTPEDKDELIQEYELTQDEADDLCSEMERIIEINRRESAEDEASDFFDRIDELPHEDALRVLCKVVSVLLSGYGSCHLEDPAEYADNLEFDCPDMVEEIFAARSAKFLLVRVYGDGSEKAIPCQSFDEAWSKVYDWPYYMRGKELTLYDLYKICTENRSVISLLKSIKSDFFDGLQ